MPEIKLKKRYPNVSTEDFCDIFNEGLLTGLKAAGKNAIPKEWIKNKKVDFQNESKPYNYCRGMQDGFNDCIDYLLSEWEKENSINPVFGSSKKRVLV